MFKIGNLIIRFNYEDIIQTDDKTGEEIYLE